MYVEVYFNLFFMNFAEVQYYQIEKSKLISSFPFITGCQRGHHLSILERVFLREMLTPAGPQYLTVITVTSSVFVSKCPFSYKETSHIELRAQSVPL